MGIRTEKKRIYEFSEMEQQLNEEWGNSFFRLSGELDSWSDIELVSRIFYKRLEKLLYGEELLLKIYEAPVAKAIKERGLDKKDLEGIFKLQDYSLVKINTLIMQVFDAVYHSTIKHLPYTSALSRVSNAVSELLENVYKYADKRFSVKVEKQDGDFPIFVRVENDFEKIDQRAKDCINELTRIVHKVMNFDDHQIAYTETIKERAMRNDDDGAAQLGIARIRGENNCRIELEQRAEYYNQNALSILLSFPLKIYSEYEIKRIVEESL